MAQPNRNVRWQYIALACLIMIMTIIFIIIADWLTTIYPHY